jgi:hypothetical protein
VNVLLPFNSFLLVVFLVFVKRRNEKWKKSEKKKRKNNLLNSLVRDSPAVVSHETFLPIDWDSFFCHCASARPLCEVSET